MKKINQEEKATWTSDLSGKKCWNDPHYVGGNINGYYMTGLETDIPTELDIDLTQQEMLDVLEYLLKKYPKHKSKALECYVRDRKNILKI